MKKITKAGIIITGIMAASTFAACNQTNTVTVGTSTGEATNGDIGFNAGANVGADGISESQSISVPGTYKGIECGFVGDKKETDKEFSLILNEDGTGINKRNSTEFELTWKMEDGQFKMTDKYLGITIDYVGSFDGNKLTIFNGDPEDKVTYEYVYEKE